jgi:hypothetical protein
MKLGSEVDKLTTRLKATEFELEVKKNESEAGWSEPETVKTTVRHLFHCEDVRLIVLQS